MIIKELDVVELPDGRTGTVVCDYGVFVCVEVGLDGLLINASKSELTLFTRYSDDD